MTLFKDDRHDSLAAAVLANLLIVAPLAWGIVVQGVSVSRYASSVQEDGVLEWMSAWGFFVAAAVFLWAARAERRLRRLPWFSVGLALFCLLVALEEISWGQRVLGYRPPTYFLEHNFQQELNVHNLVSTSLRKLTLKAIIVGYGVALPLSALAAPVRRLLDRSRLWTPPIAFTPGFAVAAVAYQLYPLKYTGELVELMLAAAFLFSALSAPALETPPRRHVIASPPRARRLVSGALLVFLLGAIGGALSTRARHAHPGNIEAARGETAALERDLAGLIEANDGEAPSSCGLHRRVYTWVTKEDVDALFEGAFAGLQAQGLPLERADYFLDPWNSPYWIRHRCSSSRQRITVYSFGPNRRRDSDRRTLGGDDIGIVLELPPDDD